MRKLCIVLFGILFALLITENPSSLARANALQNANNTNRTMSVPHRRGRRGRDVARRRHRGIGHTYKGAGQSAGRGGKRFGKNIAHGKPIKAGREMGRGMGGMGKGVGKGTARTGKKVGRKVKHAVTP